MKINYKDRIQLQSGMSLLEVLLAVLLANVVIGVAIAIFSQGQLTYTKGQDKVDAQSQLRVALNNVKMELSVATAVEIADSTGTFAENTLYFYVEDNALVLNAPVLSGGVIVTKIKQVSLPLPNLNVTFSISPLDTNQKMLRVRMIAKEGKEGSELDSIILADLYSDILVQNTSTGISGLTEGSVLIFKSVQ